MFKIKHYKSEDGFGHEWTLFINGKHRVRWNSPRATTPTAWRFIRGGDENCNRALTWTMWPIGMIDVWWETKWRTDEDGMCDQCIEWLEE